MLEAVTYQGVLKDINNNQVREDTIGKFLIEKRE